MKNYNFVHRLGEKKEREGARNKKKQQALLSSSLTLLWCSAEMVILL